MSDCFTVITEEVSNPFSNSGVLLLYLHYVTIHNQKGNISEDYLEPGQTSTMEHFCKTLLHL